MWPKKVMAGYGISVFLLLIFIQLTFLVLSSGAPNLSNEVSFHFCQHGELSWEQRYRSPVSEAESKIKINICTTVVNLSFYLPVALVAFALLAMLLAAYGKDRAALWFSMVCQVTSSLLLLPAFIAFMLLDWSYVSWEHKNPRLYICVGVQVQLVIVTVLTDVLRRRLTSDWE